MIPIFSAFTQFTPTIPKFYWDVYSQEERIKAICKEMHKAISYAEAIGEDSNKLEKMVAELEQQFEKFKESGFADYYAEQIDKWVKDNMADIISESIKMLWFGINDDGYFVAYIPDSWDDIQFDTGFTYGEADYGCLILSAPFAEIVNA